MDMIQRFARLLSEEKIVMKFYGNSFLAKYSSERGYKPWMQAISDIVAKHFGKKVVIEDIYEGQPGYDFCRWNFDIRGDGIRFFGSLVFKKSPVDDFGTVSVGLKRLGTPGVDEDVWLFRDKEFPLSKWEDEWDVDKAALAKVEQLVRSSLKKLKA